MFQSVDASRPKKETYILWIGNHIAGKEIKQNRKKHIKSLVVVPDEAGM